MTILEELVDAAFKVCENSRSAGQLCRARGAVVLTSSGKTYSGCDVQVSSSDAMSVSAERAAMLASVADGASKFDVSLLCSVFQCCIYLSEHSVW